MNSSLRVIHILGFPRDFNGNVSRVLGEAIHVAKLGCTVDVIVSDQMPRNNLKQAMDSGVNFHLLGGWIPFREIGWRINNIIPMFVKALKIVDGVSNSIVHIGAPTPVTKPLTACEIGRHLKKSMVLDIHDPWSASPFSNNLISMLQTQIMKHVINNADFVIVAHTALYKLVRGINKSKPVDIIPNCVDTELFRPRLSSPSTARRVGIDGNDFVVAFSGHIMEHKGVNILVRSAHIICQRHDNVKFLIIGDGSARKRIEALAEKLGLRDAFRFIGFVPHELVAEYLSLADICVAPYKPMAWFKVSLPETPLKVVEYMGLGKPVIMSRISDDNVISWSDGGILVKPSDVSELASSIINLLEDEKLRKKMGEKGRRFVEEHLSWKKVARRLVEIYQSL